MSPAKSGIRQIENEGMEEFEDGGIEGSGSPFRELEGGGGRRRRSLTCWLM